MNPTRVCPFCRCADSVFEGSAVWPLRWTCGRCGYTTPMKDGIPLIAPSIADTIHGFDPEAFDFLANVELDHFWFVSRRKLIVALADKFAPTARSFLEVGCGAGNVLGAVASSRVWNRIMGMDLHPRGLSLARTRLPPSVELLQGDARRIPLRDTFDLIGAFDVLEHVAEDEAVMTSIRAALVHDGIFLAAVPQHPALWSASDDVAHHVRRYPRGELDRKIAAAGFELLFSTSYAASLLPLIALRRQGAERFRHQTDPRTIARKELEVAPVTNRLLSMILDAEIALTRRGVRWPAGGSRIVAARKI
jgi:SAM-dependent methyltransferase/ribosomal protein S27AE